MITRDSIETAYCFMHQKHRIYTYSTLEWQRDDIEYAIGEYADSMDSELLGIIAEGKPDFLKDHKRFEEDIAQATDRLERMLGMT